MKKILLIIILIMTIFQLVVIATAIDIGNAAIDRAAACGVWTLVDAVNPANASGTITSVEIWAAGYNLKNCEVATFYVVSGNNLSTRDSEAIGTVTKGSKQTFVVNLDVVTGDYIGIYYTEGELERASSGGADWYHAGDMIPVTDHTFLTASDILSLYGTGTTPAAGGNAIMMGINF